MQVRGGEIVEGSEAKFTVQMKGKAGLSSETKG